MKPVGIAIVLLFLLVANAWGQDDVRYKPLFVPHTIGLGTGLYEEVTIDTYHALAAHVRFAEEKEVQRLNIAPWKLRGNMTACGALCDVTVNIARSKGVATFGIGWAYNQAAPYSNRNIRAADDLNLAALPAKRPQGEDEADVEYQMYSRAYLHDVLYGGLYTPFFVRLINRSWAFRTSLNSQQFEVLSSTARDLNEDGNIDNAYWWKGLDASVAADYTHSLASGGSLSYHFTRARATAVEGRKLATYHGIAGSVSGRIVVLDPDYRRSRPYLESLFVPAVYLIGVVAYRECTGLLDMCEDRARRRLVLAPGVDVRLAPSSQLRLTLPLTYRRVADKSSVEALPALSFAFQLSAL